MSNPHPDIYAVVDDRCLFAFRLPAFYTNQ
jgi:hypothetical protein